MKKKQFLDCSESSRSAWSNALFPQRGNAVGILVASVQRVLEASNPNPQNKTDHTRHFSSHIHHVFIVSVCFTLKLAYLTPFWPTTLEYSLNYHQTRYTDKHRPIIIIQVELKLYTDFRWRYSDSILYSCLFSNSMAIKNIKKTHTHTQSDIHFLNEFIYK